MKRIATTIALSAMAVASTAQVYVAPHIRSDGTFVDGHYRSSPDNTRLNNYSSENNFNPYTGQRGSENPYAPRTPSHDTRSPSYPSGLGQTCGYTSSGRYVCR